MNTKIGWKAGVCFAFVAGLLAIGASLANAQGMTQQYGSFRAAVPFNQAMARAQWAIGTVGYQQTSHTGNGLSARRENLFATITWTQVPEGVDVHLTVTGLQPQNVTSGDFMKIFEQFRNPNQTNDVKVLGVSTPVRGQKFNVTYSVPATYARDGFFAVVSSPTAGWRGRHTVEWLNGRASGTLEIMAPYQSGKFYLAFYDRAAEADNIPPLQSWEINVQ